MNTLFRLIFFVFILMAASSVWGYAKGAPVGVIYPELREPYKKVFNTIIGGIEREMGNRVDRYPLNSVSDFKGIEAAIKNHENQVVLVLGLRGIKAVNRMNIEIPVIAGAILPSSVNGLDALSGGITLVPDPDILFRQLLAFAPSIKTVSVVYNPEVNQILIDRAAESAKILGLKLDPKPAKDIRGSALIYKELAENIDNRKNAIWLLQDSTTMDSDSVLPSLLEQTWKRKLVLFSSKLVHAKRGVLFSMYPDNFKMGRDLGKLAKAVESGNRGSSVSVLRSLKLAVNMRTAKHLGINFSARDERSFDLVFPRPE